MINKNYTELILKGIKEGDQIGGPFELAKILSESLVSNNTFEENELRSRYLSWWKNDAFDTEVHMKGESRYSMSPPGKFRLQETQKNNYQEKLPK